MEDTLPLFLLYPDMYSVTTSNSVRIHLKDMSEGVLRAATCLFILYVQVALCCYDKWG
jgi:hypothetical protein